MSETSDKHTYKRIHITFEVQDAEYFTHEEMREIYAKCQDIGFEYKNGQVSTGLIAIPQELLGSKLP